MLWLSMGVAKNVSMEAFYQFDAPRTQPDAAGTFWATNDFAAVGGTRADLSFGLAPEGTPNETIPRLPDNKPGKSGQFRSEERRVGKECVRKWRSWWSPYH